MDSSKNLPSRYFAQPSSSGSERTDFLFYDAHADSILPSQKQAAKSVSAPLNERMSDGNLLRNTWTECLPSAFSIKNSQTDDDYFKPVRIGEPRRSEDFPRDGWTSPLDRNNAVLKEPHNNIWDFAETAGGVYTGAFAAKKYAPQMLELGRGTNSVIHNADKTRALQLSFSSNLGATVVDMLLDRAIRPGEEKMEATTIADWFLLPAISICPSRWWLRLGLQVTAHQIGRWIDHYHQPKRYY